METESETVGNVHRVFGCNWRKKHEHGISVLKGEKKEVWDV